MTYRCSPAPTPALNLLAATTALCLAWPAHAGRPLSVDDAGVDEVGQGHVEVWWEGQRGQPGTVYMAPAFTPNAGVTIPRQSRGHSGCEPLKAAVRGR